MPLEAKGQRRVGSAAVFTAVQVSASGRITRIAYEALTCPKLSLGQPASGQRYRSCEVGAASTGSADSTFTTPVYAVKFGYPANGNDAQDVELQLLGSLVCTVGSGVGATDSGVVKTTERIVKTMAWTASGDGTSPPGIADFLKAVFSAASIRTYSPGGALPARIAFTDMGNADAILFDVGSTGGSSIVFYADVGT